MNKLTTKAESTGHQFGTFGGVFTPSILTIFGVIMFMRAPFVTGAGGIKESLIILGICNGITFLTALSIAAISTNMRMKGGGAYFMISRVLGPEFGGSIGVALYIAQAISVPFYVIGFVEALTSTFPVLHFLSPWLQYIVAGLLFVLAYVGAHWSVRVQYIVLAAIGAAILFFMLGCLVEFSPSTFRNNLEFGESEEYSFWHLFAIYFPAVTGIFAGVNMSGDLKEPRKSIPNGTLAAVGVGFVVYGLQIVVCGGAIPREELIGSPFESLVTRALFGAGFMVVLGVFAATLSSAIASLVAAPRVLQALARDALLPGLGPFASGTTDKDEPRRALWLTLVITFFTIWCAQNFGKDSGLNFVASLITMFFLLSYGMVNVAAFVESRGENPSFRPRFKLFHWTVALLGGVGCAGTMLLIDPVAGCLAGSVVAGLYWFVRKRQLETAFGDARRGFVYARVRRDLMRLATLHPHPKNWRPTIVVMCRNPALRYMLTYYALWLESGRGLVTLVRFEDGNLLDSAKRRAELLREAWEFVLTNGFPVFPEVIVAHDFDAALAIFLQSHLAAPLKPNLMVTPWPASCDDAASFVQHLRFAHNAGMSIVCVVNPAPPPPVSARQKNIDVWWRGLRNGALMILLAHLMHRHLDWSGTNIRLIRLVKHSTEEKQAYEELLDLIERGRLDAKPRVVVSTQPFDQVLQKISGDSAAVFLGFSFDDSPSATEFCRRYSQLTQNMPPCLLVWSSGEVDVFA